MSERWVARSKAWAKGMAFAWTGLFFGIALALTVGWTLYQQALASQTARFEQRVGLLDAGLFRNLEAQLELLRAAQGFCDAGPVNAETWAAFTHRVNIGDRYPGLRSLGYIQLVKRGQQEAYARTVSQEIGVELRMKPFTQEIGAFARFAEPALENPGVSNAMDLTAEPVRWEGILRAIETDELTATRPLSLIGTKETARHPNAAIVAYLPVYRRGSNPQTPEARREAAEGVVFVSVLGYQVFEPLLAHHANLFVEVRDEAVDPAVGPLYTNAPEDASYAGGRFTRSFIHKVGQRQWRFSYRDPRSEASILGLWHILPHPFLGVLLSGLFFLLVRSLIRGRATAERLAERLQQSEERFRRVAEQAPCGILLLTERIRYVNPFFLASLGYAAGDVIGASFRSFVHPEDHARLDALATQHAEGAPLRVELRIFARNREIRWVEITLGRLALGRRPMILATAFDVTDRRIAEERRLEAERGQLEVRKHESLRVLAGGIAHDFNNLLGVILGHADLLETQAAPDPKLRTLREACLKAAGLTRQLLAFSGGGGMVSSPTDLNACIRQALPRLAPDLKPEGRVELSCGADLPQVLADPALLEQTVLELVENGLEAALENQGSVTVQSDCLMLEAEALAEFREAEHLEPGEFVRLSVEDRGHGMSADHLARIFDPFFTTKFVGRGLGLAALLGVARSHGGAVRVTSRVGEGTRFEVILPAHGRVETSTAPASRGAGRGTVLVVDDEPGILELAVEILQSAGLPVLAASGGREALAKVAAHRDEISVMLLDMAMPDLSGAEVIQALRVSNPGIRVILSSGYAEEDLRKNLQPRDIVAFLPKPYRLSSLVDLVKDVLAKAE